MEGLATQIDIYCERTDASYWSEPVNAVSNAAFLIAAAVMLTRVRGQHMPIAVALCWILAAIGVTSYLWHTHAQAWASALDVGSIAAFIFTYVYAANRHFWALRPPLAALATLGVIPWIALTLPVFDSLPFFHISNAYWPIALLIALYAVALWRRHPETARGLALGAAILTLSLAFRSVDAAVCHLLPT
ncbi:MAG: ceramidase domain-containing protein, partial [Pseudomonadota bacterium]